MYNIEYVNKVKGMSKKIVLDELEKDIDSNFDKLKTIKNSSSELDKLKVAAKEHLKAKKSTTIRISEGDLEMMRVKASKLGILYQTYINILIHKDATEGSKSAL